MTGRQRERLGLPKRKGVQAKLKWKKRVHSLRKEPSGSAKEKIEKIGAFRICPGFLKKRKTTDLEKKNAGRIGLLSRRNGGLGEGKVITKIRRH